MSDQLVYLQCSIKVLCIKKSVLQKVPYLMGLVNFENNGTHDNPAIVEGCSYKALKYILLSAESNFEVYYPEYQQEYEYLNIDTKPMIKKNNAFPNNNISYDNIMRASFIRKDNNINNILQMKKIDYGKICIIMKDINEKHVIQFKNHDMLEINTLVYLYEYYKSHSINDSVFVDKFDDHIRVYISSINIKYIESSGFYIIPDKQPNPLNVSQINYAGDKQDFDLNSEKSYFLISSNKLDIDTLNYCSKNNFSIQKTNSHGCSLNPIWEFPDNPKFNIPGNVLNVKISDDNSSDYNMPNHGKNLIYYDITTMLRSYNELKVSNKNINYEDKLIHSNSLTVLEL